MNQWVAKLMTHLSESQVDAYIVTRPENMQYFSGFTGEGMLVLHPQRQVIVTDFRYTEAAGKQAPDFEALRVTNYNHEQVACQVLEQLGATRVGIEGDSMLVDQYQKLLRYRPGLELKPVGLLMDLIRAVKEESELALIRQACALTDDAFAYILGQIKPGMTELEVGLLMERYVRENGGGVAFPFIVASGENGSLPHAEPSERALRYGDMITMDFGASWGRYCSDMTRTVSLGEPSAELRKIYEITLIANQRAEEALRPGVSCGAVDAVARGIIGQAGYGDKFGHGLGHGFGRLIHEQPRLATGSAQMLEPNMVVTVEPGIYLPGVGGVRIEDSCLITSGGYERLTQSPRELIVL